LSNGSASYTFSSTVSGTHVETATYSGDSNFASSTGTITLTIGTTGGTTSGSGGSGSTTVTVTPSGGFTGTVDLSLYTSSTYLQDDACYDLSSADVTGTSPVSRTLTVYLGTSYCSSAQLKGKVHAFRSAGHNTGAAVRTTGISKGFAMSVAGTFVMGLMTLRRRRRTRVLCGVLLAAAFSFALAGCGNTGTSSSSKSFTVSLAPSTMTISAGSSGVPTGSYSLTLTGSSSSLSSSATLSLTVD